MFTIEELLFIIDIFGNITVPLKNPEALNTIQKGQNIINKASLQIDKLKMTKDIMKSS
jgi:hypothetical protein